MSASRWLLALALLVLGVVGIVLLTKQPETLGRPEDGQDSEETPYNGAPAQTFTFQMPETWKYFTNAQKDIQELVPAQTIRFGVVSDPNDAGRSYFVASAGNPNLGDTATLHSIYAYNEQDYSFERIYKVNSGPEIAFPGIRKGAYVDLHAIGQDQLKLIILAQDADSSPGRCTEVLALGRDADDEVYEMLSLDLTNPYAKGLEPYRVPDEIYNAALERQNTCAAQQ